MQIDDIIKAVVAFMLVGTFCFIVIYSLIKMLKDD